MIAIVDNGGDYSGHTIYFVDVGEVVRETVEGWIKKGANEFWGKAYLLAFVPNDGTWWAEGELCDIEGCDVFPSSMRFPDDD